MQPEWRDQLGLLGKKEAAKIILQGGWEEDPMWDDQVLELVCAMEFATSARTWGPLDMKITWEDFQYCWTRAQECTLILNRLAIHISPLESYIYFLQYTAYQKY